MLRHQARVYREYGAGVKKLPDDILAVLFVGAFYLRMKFWERLSSMFHWDEDTREEQEKKWEQIGRRSRYARRGNRHARAASWSTNRR